ncbi:MAG: hypothetical protein R3B52_00050 [Candidatus Paceibacterota bacterium]
MKKTIIAAVGVLSILSSVPVVGAAELSVQSLSGRESAILPGNPFYFLKSWAGSMRGIFADTKEQKLVIETNRVNKKASEIFQAEVASGRQVSEQVRIDYATLFNNWANSIALLSADDQINAKSIGYESKEAFFAYLLGRVATHYRFADEKGIEINQELVNQALTRLEELMGTETFASEVELIKSTHESPAVNELFAN